MAMKYITVVHHTGKISFQLCIQKLSTLCKILSYSNLNISSNDLTHIGVPLSILRDPLEIVSLVSSGLEKVKQLEHGDAISFDAFSYLQSNCF